MAYGTLLTALADPTRRALFERMRYRSYTVGELAEHSKIRQPTVSQHLQVLRQARLVEDRQEGTRRHCRATRAGLDALRAYLESLGDDVLQAYAADDPNLPARRRRTKPPRRR